MADTICEAQYCPLCTFEAVTSQLRLAGVCQESRMDRIYIMSSTEEFVGLINSKIQFSRNNQRWEIVGGDGLDSLLAHTDTPDFPLGRRSWHFVGSNCSDPGETFRSLNLHPDVRQPGNFCCDSGLCLDSQLVCNNFDDCRDNSDERNCSLVSLVNVRNKDLPAIEITDQGNQLLAINVTFTFLQIFDVQEVDSYIDLYFDLRLQWFDKSLIFQFLKSEESANAIPRHSVQSIWTPRVAFEIVSKFEDDDQLGSYLVSRRGEPRLAEDDVTELYDGRDNPISLFTRRRIRFTCSFDNIINYPFGSQTCKIIFYLQGADNALTVLSPYFIDKGQKKIGQYFIDKWEIAAEEEGKQRRVSVVMVLSRKIRSIFTVTYLPTILMNLINQSSNYIRGDTKYDLVYTINITCMMVLASVYLSVSASLPRTSDIKPIGEFSIQFSIQNPNRQKEFAQ